MSNSTAKAVGVTVALMALTTIFVSVRVFVRSFIFRSMGWDDALVFLSYALAMALCGCVLAMVTYGLGTPIADVSMNSFQKFLEYQFAASLTYVWSAVTIKTSFAVLYLRLLPGDFCRHLNQFLIILFVAEGLASTTVVVFQCRPVDKIWHPEKEGKCLDLRLFYYIIFGIKLLTDICLFIQPIPIIWRLQLSKEKRLGVIFMLSIGLFVCIIAVIRVTTIHDLARDVTKDLVNPLIWSQAEVCALIICATIPSFRPFFRYFPAVSKVMGLSSFQVSDNPSSGRSPLVPSSSIRNRSRASDFHSGLPTSPRPSVVYGTTAYCLRDTSVSAQHINPQSHHRQDGILVTRSFNDDIYTTYQPVV